MIVLLSRARLGFYLLGNVGYFESNGSIPKHWGATFDRLQLPASNDSVGTDEDHIFLGEQTGSALPVCCPVHRHVVANVISIENLKLGFCKKPCRDVLRCGHACSLECHWPSKQHNARCHVPMDSPCKRHPAPVVCHSVFACSKSAPSATDHTRIMDFYECPELVSLAMPCNHIINRKCHVEKKISDGTLPRPACHKPSPVPFVFTDCGHELVVTCHKLETFNGNPGLAKCSKVVTYEPPCQHEIDMVCHKRQNILRGNEVYICNRKVTVNLPRCGHSRNVPCPDSQKISSWMGKACDEVGIVEEGVSYGARDYACNKSVTVRRKCGHTLSLPCGEAFNRSCSLHDCREKIEASHPVCGHKTMVTCKMREDLKISGSYPPAPLDSYEEGQIPHRTSFAGAPLCREMVKLTRKCGHAIDLACSEIGKPLETCKIHTASVSPLCGHSITIPCGLRKQLPGSFWSEDTFKELCESHKLLEKAQITAKAREFPPETKYSLQTCQSTTTVQLECGHDKDVTCATLLDVAMGLRLQCNEPVARTLACGHSVQIQCHESENPYPRLCPGKKQRQCWNHSVCQNVLEVSCGLDGPVACTGESLWTCPSGRHTLYLRLCSEGTPLSCLACSMESFDEYVDAPECLRNETRDQLESHLSGLSGECLITPATIGFFRTKEVDLLKRRQAHARTQFGARDQVLCSYTRVLCFRSLAKSNISMDTFDPKKCVRGDKTFHGIVSKLWTGENLQKLAEKDDTFTLLVGFAAVSHTMTLGKSPPTKKRDKKALAISLTTNGFDSMSYKDEKGFQSLLVLEPFPMVAVCRLELSRRELYTLSQELSAFKSPNLEPRPVLYSSPPSDCTTIALSLDLQQGKILPMQDVDDDDSEGVIDEMESEAKELLSGTEFDGFPLLLHWSGGIELDEEIPAIVEKNLAKKLHCLHPNGPPPDDPFGAIKYIRTLLDEPNMESLNIFLAAESLQHSVKDAKEALEKYKDFVRSRFPGSRLHPLSLLVAARLNGRSETANTLISIFNHFYPLNSKFLSDEEKECLRGAVQQEKPDHDAHSTILKQWDELKTKYPEEVSSQATEKLLNLTGLRKVKEEAIRTWNTAIQLKRMSSDARKENQMTANYVFLGNPGTGKTTVARLFARMLRDCGIRQNGSIEEITAQQAKDGGTDEFRKVVKSAMGGTLFIDEAYDLDPIRDFQGKPIVNELLTLCENRRDEISVILAGYEDDFHKKFFAYNVGLKSRFREVAFEDFDENELAKIWSDLRTAKHWKEEDHVCRVAVKRLVKMAGRKGFGNAREIRRYLETATQNAMSRLGEHFSRENMILKISDVIGEDPRLLSEKLKSVQSEIDEKIGWQRVKDKVKELIELCGTNYERQLLGKPQLPVFLNRMFLGSPGTGKTTCAKLYGRLLKELGFLTSGEVVMKSSSDFVGQYIGESQTKTVQILEQAKGKVLLIDEAYALGAYINVQKNLIMYSNEPLILFPAFCRR